jgi:hypothetical protein
VIHIHAIDDGEIEIILDHRMRNVRRQLRMPFHDRHRPRPPTFIGGFVLRRTADREGRNEIEVESGRVIVVNQEDDVGCVSRKPRFGGLVAGEHGLPVVIAGLAQVERSADGRNVRGVNAGSDGGHQGSSFLVR